MNILVINAGSSSLKYQLIDIAKRDHALERSLRPHRYEGAGPSPRRRRTADPSAIDEDMPTHKEAIELVLKALVDKEGGRHFLRK